MPRSKKLPKVSKISKVNKASRISKIAETVIEIAIGCMIFGSLIYFATRAPEIHGAYIRHKVGSKVYTIKGRLDGGGGTGFAVKADSGKSYILTNAHVCEGVNSQSSVPGKLLAIDIDGKVTTHAIIEVSDFSDLCLLEGEPGVTGLELGSEPAIGEIVAAVGHPKLRPLSLSRGEIVGKTDVEIVEYVMPTGDFLLDMTLNVKNGRCDKPKNRIQEYPLEIKDNKGNNRVVMVPICLNVTYKAYMSTVVIYPGSSGSPIVNFYGNIVGVAFAADETNYACIVSLRDVIKFLSDY